MIALAECPLVGFPTSAILSFSGWPWYQFQLSFTIHLGFEHNYAVEEGTPGSYWISRSLFLPDTKACMILQFVLDLSSEVWVRLGLLSPY